MTQELVDMLRRASMLVADIRLVAEVTESLRPVDRDRLRQVQGELLEIRGRSLAPVFLDEAGAG